VRPLLIRCRLAIVAALLLCAALRIPAQSTWQTIATNHFEIYYERQSADRVDRVASEAEQAYSRISSDLRFDLAAKVPLIVVPSESDLPTSRAAAAALVDESGAPLRDHLVVALEPTERRQGSLTHELTHHFTWELTPPDRGIVPAWFDEGLSEYERVRWTSALSGTVRTFASAPSIAQISSSDRDLSRRVFEFIGDEFGIEGIRRYLTTLKSSTSSNAALQEAFGLSSGEFDRAFQRYLSAH